MRQDISKKFSSGITRREIIAATAIVGISALSSTTRAQAPYPANGQRLSLIVGATAGSGADLTARLTGAMIEREYSGTQVQVINRPGAGTQVAVQAIADAPADGSTFGLVSLPTAITLVLDAERKARFTRTSFLPIANFAYDPGAIAVRSDSPHKTLKDFIEAAKKAPGTVTVGVTGARGREHLDVIGVELASGARFNPVFHNDSGLALNNLLGGSINAVQGSVADFVSQVRAGRVRMLAVFDKNRSPFASDVPTGESQGFAMFTGTSRGYAFPANTPRYMAERLSAAIGKASQSPEEQKRIQDMGLELRFMDATAYARYWDEEVVRITTLMKRIA